MTRRGFSQLLAAWLAALHAPQSTPHTYVGRMTLARWHREGYAAARARVLLDGRDISNECFEFDDRTGEAQVFVRNANGRFHLNAARTGAATRVLHGRITIEGGITC